MSPRSDRREVGVGPKSIKQVTKKPKGMKPVKEPKRNPATSNVLGQSGTRRRHSA